MRGVWKLRFVPSLLVLGALLFLIGGGDDADAAPFKPRLSASVSNNAPGAPADLTTDFGWGNSQEFFPEFAPGTADREAPTNFASFTPASWGIPDCSPTATCPYPIGTKTGTVRSTTTLGLFNGDCGTAVPVVLDGDSQPPYPGNMATTPLLNASTNNSAGNTILAGDNFLNLTNDNNSNQIMDGAEFWNNLLAALGLPAPRERQVANTNLFGTNVWVDLLTYNPGVVAPAALGYTTLQIIENFNPAQTPQPGLITDSCGLSTIGTQLGMAANGAVHRSNPTTPGTKFFFLNSLSDRDADQGPAAAAEEPTTFQADARRGFVNSDDTCPFTPNVGSPHQPGTPFNGDDEAENGNQGPDGIDNACDPNPLVGEGGDVDGDDFQNRGDNCVFINNPTQADTFELGPLDPFELGTQPIDGGPRNDAIGNACDINPTVPDGHFHGGLNVASLCISVPAGTPGEPFPGAFLDSDSDGYCNLEEVALGSSPGNPASKPEALAVPTTCSDGFDNDADGNADLADGSGGPSAPNGCQTGTVHDVKLSSLSGKKNVNSGQTANYKAIILASGETAQMGIIVDPISGGGCSFTGSPAADPVSNVTGSSNVTTTVTNEGPINIDGDSEVEWLVKLQATQAVVADVDRGQVTFDVTFPVCATLGRVANYNIAVDLCHGNDIAPLGLFGAGDCGAPSDGAQDLNPGNDAVITRTIK